MKMGEEREASENMKMMVTVGRSVKITKNIFDMVSLLDRKYIYRYNFVLDMILI